MNKRVTQTLILFLVTILSFSFIQKDKISFKTQKDWGPKNLFHKTKNSSWCLKRSTTYVNNSRYSSRYICLSKKGKFIYKIDREGPSGIAAGTYKLNRDTILLTYDSIETVKIFRTLKEDKDFFGVREKLKNLKFKLNKDELILIEKN